MQKVRRHPLPRRAIGLRPLVGTRFQVLFTRLVAVLFIVQSPYSFAIGHRGVFSLGRWAGRIRAGFHEPRATLVRLSQGSALPSPTGLSPALARLSRRFGWEGICNPSRRPQPQAEAWFGLSPRSLAATCGIHVCLCSCGYLDVSVPRVRSRVAMRSPRGDGR